MLFELLDSFISDCTDKYCLWVGFFEFFESCWCSKVDLIEYEETWLTGSYLVEDIVDYRDLHVEFGIMSIDGMHK